MVLNFNYDLFGIKHDLHGQFKLIRTHKDYDVKNKIKSISTFLLFDKFSNNLSCGSKHYLNMCNNNNIIIIQISFIVKESVISNMHDKTI